MAEPIPASGGCICGGVRYQVTDRSKLRQVVACHCEQCRRFSGHFIAATGARYPYFTLLNAETLSWYAYQPNVRQGFCQRCGSSLFFDYPEQERISIAAGSLDDSSGLTMAAQIYCVETGGYYDLHQHGERIPDGNFSLQCPA